MYTKEDVQRLVSDLGSAKSDKRDPGAARRQAADPNVPERYIGNRDIDLSQPRPNLHNVDFSEIEIGEPYMFGLALDIFDPVSGEVLHVCRPAHRDTGETEVFLTVNQIAGAVANARAFRLHNERAGLIPSRPPTDEQVEAAKKQQAEAAQREKDQAAADNAAREREAQNVRQRETGRA